MSTLSSLTINNDGFAFNTATGESYTLNDCACMILHRLCANEPPEQIVQAISSEFNVAQPIIERDMTEFIQQLRTLGLTGVKS